MQDKKIIYYSDELNDDFAGNNIKTKEIPDDYRFVNNCLFFKIITFIVYRIIVTPGIHIYIEIKYHLRIKNRKLLRQARGQGCFIFGNHTNGDLDAFVPTLISFPKKAYIIANPDVISIPGIGTLVKMLGAVPLPENIKLYKRFLGAIEKRISEKSAVAIYPEAHIWPYYTGIRDFNPTSLSYAVMNNAPVYAFTNVYVKRRFVKRPRVITYIDGPFYPDKNLSRKENVSMLKDKVYGAMKARNEQHPKYEYKYVYVRESR